MILTNREGTRIVKDGKELQTKNLKNLSQSTFQDALCWSSFKEDVSYGTE